MRHNSVRFYKNLNLITIKFTKDLAENARFFYMYKYEQIAKATTSKGRYQVLLVTAPLGNQYYQIQKNRVVISNYSAVLAENKIRAISCMLQLADKDIKQLELFQHETRKSIITAN